MKALVRPGSDRRNLAGLDLELWEGDLRDRQVPGTGAERVRHALSRRSRLPALDQETGRHVRNQCRRDPQHPRSGPDTRPFPGGLHQQRRHSRKSRQRHSRQRNYPGHPRRHGRSLQKEQVSRRARGGGVCCTRTAARHRQPVHSGGSRWTSNRLRPARSSSIS